MGRADLIEAAAANASPHQFMARGMKVAKEEIVGLVRALEVFVDEDEVAENEHYREMCQTVVDALVEVPGIRVTVEHDEYDYNSPTAVIKLTGDWNGADRNDILASMAQGDPSIFLHSLCGPDEVAVDPFNLDDEELETVIRRLREELTK